MAKDGERLLVKAKRRKIKENAIIDESIGVSEFSSKIKKKAGAQKVAKNGERLLLIKAKQRKITENATIDESIGALEFPSKIKNKAAAQKAKNGERLLVKAKRRKITENATIDESSGVLEFPSKKINKAAALKVAKNSKRLLIKAKRRKIKENVIIDDSIGVLEFSSKNKKKAGAHKAKNGDRLLVKAKGRKIKVNATIDESIGALEFSSKIKKKAGAHNELKRGTLDHLKNNNKTSIKKKLKKAMRDGGGDAMIEQLSHDDEHTVEGIGSGRLTNVDKPERSNYQTLNEIDSSVPKVAASDSKIRTKKVTKDFKYKNKHHSITAKTNNTEDTQGEVGEDKVDEIPLVDEDCTRGMKKWLIRYKESRPGLKVLQQRIDEFVTAHEELQERERREREAHAAEGGWTVVVHHKGRKKTTDIESGTTVGSVAPAAVMDRMSKKKKNIAIDFYRFQKKEAKRNELMMLQSKFEQDKKRIQHLRATRKFKPY